MEVFQGLKKLGIEERSTDFKFSFTVQDEAEINKKKKKNKKSKKKKKAMSALNDTVDACGLLPDSEDENNNQAENTATIITNKSASINTDSSRPSSDHKASSGLLAGNFPLVLSSSTTRIAPSPNSNTSTVPPPPVASIKSKQKNKNKNNNKKKKKKRQDSSSSQPSSSAAVDEDDDWETAIAESMSNYAAIIEEQPPIIATEEEKGGGGPSIISSRHDPSIDNHEKLLRRFGKGKSLVNTTGPVKVRDSSWLLNNNNIHSID